MIKRQRVYVCDMCNSWSVLGTVYGCKSIFTVNKRGGPSLAMWADRDPGAMARFITITEGPPDCKRFRWHEGCRSDALRPPSPEDHFPHLAVAHAISCKISSPNVTFRAGTVPSIP
ncbi:hypothetical protein BCR44DRAFT_1241412 [Catenaria anguillulae PL171]|uniref:Uncharacterized protein n=1 Tax=Catenaria anguillulae PL171 TaxID=765915 RepID=A0A1Y2HGW2_9FUNG|nr:hypothetical protein BCR44DRAFT_1241412 [Catenaria anguillulae PL171]